MSALVRDKTLSGFPAAGKFQGFLNFDSVTEGLLENKRLYSLDFSI